MALTYQQVAGAEMKLTPDERVELAEKLWGSVDSPEAIAAAWDLEIERRIAQLDAGEVGTVLIRLSPNLKTAGCFSVESGTAPLISTPCGAAIQGIAAKSAIKWDCSRALGDNRISTVGTILAEEVIDELRARLM